jgi:hypothetical protein
LRWYYDIDEETKKDVGYDSALEIEEVALIKSSI